MKKQLSNSSKQFLNNGFDTDDAFSDLDDDFVVNKSVTDYICVGTGVQKKPYQALILFFQAINLDEDNKFYQVRYYVNAKINSKHFRVEINSKFAKLYRELFGIIDEARYRKTEQLFKHFVGIQFKCHVERQRVNGLYLNRVREIVLSEQSLEADIKVLAGCVKVSTASKNRKRLRTFKNNALSEDFYKNVISHSKYPDESKDEYDQRVIEETFFVANEAL